MKNLDMIFEELSHIEYMVKENNSELDSNLVYEAFWDTVRQGAAKIGQAGANIRNAAVKGYNAVVGGIDYVKELGQKAWDKIVSLGQDFVTWVQGVVAKVKEIVNVIKGTPAQAMAALKSLYAYIAEFVGKKIQDIKSGWETFITIMDKFIFTPIANAYSDMINNIDKSITYLKVVAVEDITALKQFATEQKNKGSEKWNSMMTKLSEILAAAPEKIEEFGQYLLKIGKGAALIVVGLIILPFYGAFKGGELVYKLGEKFVQSISTACGEFWNELKTLPGAVATGYQSVQKVPVRENRTVLPFDQFLKNKK